MSSWLKDFLYHLIGIIPAGGVIECKSYSVIQYLEAIDYKGDFYTKLKQNTNDCQS